MPESNHLPTIAACVTQRRRLRLEQALAGVANLAFVDSFERLAGRITAERPRLVILDARDAFGWSVETTLNVLEPFHGCAVLIYASSDEIASGALARCAVADVIIADITDSPALVRSLVIKAIMRLSADRVVMALNRRIAGPLAIVVETAVRFPACATVEAIAERIGVHRQTLALWCRSANHFHPEELLVWCRLLLVSALLETTGYSLQAMATTLGFPSVVALRNQLKRYTGLRAMEIRDAGLDAILARFDANEREHRGPPPSSASVPMVSTAR